MEAQRTPEESNACPACGYESVACRCDVDDDFEEPEWEDDADFDEAMDNCHGHFDEPGPGGIFHCGAVGSEDCDECPMHRWLGLTNRQIDRLEEIDE